MIAGMTYYEICWFFLLYSALGWVVEVVYCTLVSGKIKNRGFLNGPVCPVYGFGMLALLACLHLVMDGVGKGGARVEDTGGDIKGPHRIDLWFPSEAEAFRWGRQKNLPVTVWTKD